MNMDRAEERYRGCEDPVFNSFVDMVFHTLINGHLSVYEVRDASTLGMNKYAIHKPPEPIFVTKEQAEQFRRGEMMTGKPSHINELANSNTK